LKSTEIRRGEENEFDEPVIGNFTKYSITYSDIVLGGQSFENARGDIRGHFLELIAEALGVKADRISKADFQVEPNDPRLIIMNLVLADGTQIKIPIIDKSAIEEE
jgi:hypothetical protein